MAVKAGDPGTMAQAAHEPKEIGTPGDSGGLPIALRREGLFKRVLPFAFTALVVFGSVPLDSSPHDRPGYAWIALGLLMVIVISAGTIRWERLPHWSGISLPLGYIVVVMLLRDAEGGAVSGVITLYFLPLLWVALYGNRPELIAVVVGIMVATTGPILMLGEPRYPPIEWRRVVVFIVICSFVGVTVQRLVEQTRQQVLTEQRIQGVLRESRALLRGIMDNTPAVIYTKDLEGRYLFGNSEFKKIYGVTNQDIRGRRDDEFFDADTAAERHAVDMEVLHSRSLVDFEEGGAGAAKDRSYLSVKFPVLDPYGEILGMCDVSIDVTDRKRAQIEANRAKDEFFSLVSHELRTPLTSIAGYVEELLTEEDGELNDIQKRFALVIKRNSDRLRRLVGDLLFVAQADAGGITMAESDVDLMAVVSGAIEAARPHAASKSIELSLDTSPLPPLKGDAGRLGQLLDNLVSNAIKYTPPGGDVRVRLFAAGGAVSIEVSDTGMGIAPEEQAQMFQRFVRTRSAREQQIQGVGLGLVIAKAIAEGHGGTIGFTSREGEGTTFTVRLPC